MNEYKDMVTKFAVKAKKEDDDPKKEPVYTIIASTPTVDRDEEVILPTAFKASLPDYLASNPVILWMHDMFSPPVARAIDGRVTDSAMELDIKFASTPFAQEIKTLVDEGMLNTVSVGGSVKDSTRDESGRRVITDIELWETSIVTIPSNRGAIIQRAKALGLSVPHMEQLHESESKQASTLEPKGGKAEKSKAEKSRIAALKKRGYNG